MTPAEVREAALSLPLTQQEIAKEIGVSHGHLRNVMSGSRELSKPAQMLLARLAGTCDRCGEYCPHDCQRHGMCETCAGDMGA